MTDNQTGPNQDTLKQDASQKGQGITLKIRVTGDGEFTLKIHITGDGEVTIQMTTLVLGMR